MKHIYCLSGLGADERVFSKLNFVEYEVHFIQWIKPDKNETIGNYAKRLTAFIHHEKPVLAGLSFGGMMCIEMAKHIATEKIILISSAKTFREIPLWMRIAGKLKLNKIFPMMSFKLIEPIEDYNLGVETDEEKSMVSLYRKNIDRKYSDWAINVLINWKNTWVPPNLYHIHGSKDRLLRIKNIKADYVINNGGHFMIMNRVNEVNECIKAILESDKQ